MDFVEGLALCAPDVLLLQTVVRAPCISSSSSRGSCVTCGPGLCVCHGQVTGVENHAVQKRWKRLRRFQKDAARRVVLFTNEHHPDVRACFGVVVEYVGIRCDGSQRGCCHVADVRAAAANRRRV
jgi:hypothetical protein